MSHPIHDWHWAALACRGLLYRSAGATSLTTAGDGVKEATILMPGHSDELWEAHKAIEDVDMETAQRLRSKFVAALGTHRRAGSRSRSPRSSVSRHVPANIESAPVASAPDAAAPAHSPHQCQIASVPGAAAPAADSTPAALAPVASAPAGSDNIDIQDRFAYQAPPGVI